MVALVILDTWGLCATLNATVCSNICVKFKPQMSSNLRGDVVKSEGKMTHNKENVQIALANLDVL